MNFYLCESIWNVSDVLVCTCLRIQVFKIVVGQLNAYSTTDDVPAALVEKVHHLLARVNFPGKLHLHITGSTTKNFHSALSMIHDLWTRLLNFRECCATGLHSRARHQFYVVSALPGTPDEGALQSARDLDETDEMAVRKRFVQFTITQS